MLRLSYVADVEDAALVDGACAAIKEQIDGSLGGAGLLLPAHDRARLFWRRGAPPEQPTCASPDGR